MLITIITITYNCRNEIRPTIESIISQKNIENIEYIIIDGGSTDGTVDVINNYKSHLNFFITEPDQGISDAFNKGIQKASGQFIGLINAGDILLSDFFSKIERYNILQYDVIYGDSIINDPFNNLLYIRKCMPLNKFRYELPFVHQSCFIAKKAYDKYGVYNLDYKICMDYELISKMYYLDAKFLYLSVPISQISYGGISSTQHVKCLKERFDIAIRNGENRFPQILYNMKILVRIYIKYCLRHLMIWNYVSTKIHKKA